jgi:molybdopterin/thiamine biosynthesis adenylyltransferase
VPTTSTAAEIFSRTVTFAQSSRWAIRPAANVLIEHLSGARVLVTGDPEVLATEAGQQAATLLVNLVARFCPTLDVDVPGRLPLRVEENQLIRNPHLGDALVAVPDAIWGSARPCSDADRRAPDLIVSIGRAANAWLGVPTFCVTFGNWWGAVADAAGEWPPAKARGRSVGPLVGACLGAGALFKAVLRLLANRYPEHADDNTQWDLRSGGQCLSLLDYSLSPMDIQATGGAELTLPAVIVSAGAICSGLAYGIRVCGLHLPAVTVFDPKLIDPPDLNRYITTAAADIGRAKVDVLAPWLNSVRRVECRIEPFSGDFNSAILNQGAVFLVGVDHIPTRWAAQECWPRVLLVGATEHDYFRVSSHSSSPGEAACARCLDSTDLPTFAGEVIPSIGFVSALTGVSMAAELAKLSAPYLQEYRLNNVAGGRLLRLGEYTWEVNVRNRVPDCQLCREYGVSAG